eukprot:tig00021501_g21953.t1
MVALASSTAISVDESTRATDLAYVDLDTASNQADLKEAANFCPILKVNAFPAIGSFANGTVSGLVTIEGSSANLPDFAVATLSYVLTPGAQETYSTYWGSPSESNPVVPVSSGAWSVPIPSSDIVKLLLVPAGASVPPTRSNRYLSDAYESLALSRAMLAIGGESRSQLQWSGKVWAKKTAITTRLDPGNNYWSDSPSDVFVDAQGQLHLTLKKTNNEWYSTEVVLQDIFSYGTFIWYVDVSPNSAVPWSDPYVDLGLFMWTGTENWKHRELAIEFSQHGLKKPGNLQFGTAWDPEKDFRPDDAEKRFNLDEVRTNAGVAVSNNRFTVQLTWTAGSATLRLYSDWHCKNKLMSATERATLPKLVEETIRAPWVPTPGRQRVRMNLWKYPDVINSVKLDPKDNFYEAILGGFEYIPGGPVPISAQMPDCGTLKINFDQRIALPRKSSMVSFHPSYLGSKATPEDLASTDCSMFNLPTLEVLGGDAKCTITGPTQISVQLGANATIGPGSRVRIEANKVAAAAVSCGDNELLVTWPAVRPEALRSCTPMAADALSAAWNPGATIGVMQEPGTAVDTTLVAVVNAPQAIHACSDLALDASKTTGTCGRAVDFTWTVESASANATRLQGIRDLLASSTGAVVVVPSALLDSSTSYTFTVVVRNRKGETSTKTFTVAVVPNNMPVVKIYGARDFYPRKDILTLDTELQQAYCNGVSVGEIPPLEFIWSVRPISPAGPELGISPDAIKDMGRKLVIPVGSLTAGVTYAFRFTAVDSTKPTVSSAAIATASALYSPLSVDIPENDRTVTQQTAFSISCQATDPDAGTVGSWYSPATQTQRRRLNSLIDAYTTRRNSRRSLRDTSVPVTVDVTDISCVSGGNNGSGICEIFFGYNNPSSTPVTQDVTTSGATLFNFVTLPAGMPQPNIPTTFEPGTKAKAFSILVPCSDCTQTYSWSLRTSASDPSSIATASTCFPPSSTALVYDKATDSCATPLETIAGAPTTTATLSYKWKCEDMSAPGASCDNFVNGFIGEVTTKQLQLSFARGASNPFRFTCQATSTMSNGVVKSGQDTIKLDSIPTNSPTVKVWGPYDENWVPYPAGSRVPWDKKLNFRTEVQSNNSVGDQLVPYSWSMPDSSIVLAPGVTTIPDTSLNNWPQMTLLPNVVQQDATYTVQVNARDSFGNLGSASVTFTVGFPPRPTKYIDGKLSGLQITPPNGTAMGAPERTLFTFWADGWDSPFGPLEYRFYFIEPLKNQTDSFLESLRELNETEGTERLISSWSPMYFQSNVLLPVGILPYYYVAGKVYVRDIFGNEGSAYARTIVLPPKLSVRYLH